MSGMLPSFWPTGATHSREMGRKRSYCGKGQQDLANQGANCQDSELSLVDSIGAGDNFDAGFIRA